jgi:hypothetical protein
VRRLDEIRAWRVLLHLKANPDTFCHASPRT